MVSPLFIFTDTDCIVAITTVLHSNSSLKELNLDNPLLHSLQVKEKKKKSGGQIQSIIIVIE